MQRKAKRNDYIFTNYNIGLFMKRVSIEINSIEYQEKHQNCEFWSSVEISFCSFA